MLIKQGVDISRLNREIRRGLGVVDVICFENNEEVVVTSAYEGIHSAGSLHYGNNAFDIRLPVTFNAGIIEDIRDELGHNYDVVEKSDHVHVEYDPKGSYNKR